MSDEDEEETEEGGRLTERRGKRETASESGKYRKKDRCEADEKRVSEVQGAEVRRDEIPTLHSFEGDSVTIKAQSGSQVEGAGSDTTACTDKRTFPS